MSESDNLASRRNVAYSTNNNFHTRVLGSYGLEACEAISPCLWIDLILTILFASFFFETINLVLRQSVWFLRQSVWFLRQPVWFLRQPILERLMQFPDSGRMFESKNNQTKVSSMGEIRNSESGGALLSNRCAGFMAMFSVCRVDDFQSESSDFHRVQLLQKHLFITESNQIRNLNCFAQKISKHIF